MPAVRASNRNPKKTKPTGDCPKACTEEIMPLLVIKVPKMHKEKVNRIRERFHILSIPLLS